MKIIIAFVAILSIGCATTYNGPVADLNLRDEAAKREVENFKLRESFWSQTAISFGMGPHETEYTVESLAPNIQHVSSKAYQSVIDAQKLRTIALYFWGAAVAVFVVQLANPVNLSSAGANLAFYGLLGVSLGWSFAAIGDMTRASEEYNKDLNSKLSPKLALNWTW